MKRFEKLCVVAIAALFAIALSTGSALANTDIGFSFEGPNAGNPLGANQIEDESAEFWFDKDEDGEISEGDLFAAMVNFSSNATSGADYGLGEIFNQFTALIVFVVEDVVDPDATTSDMTFAPVMDFNAALTEMGFALPGGMDITDPNGDPLDDFVLGIAFQDTTPTIDADDFTTKTPQELFDQVVQSEQVAQIMIIDENGDEFEATDVIVDITAFLADAATFPGSVIGDFSLTATITKQFLEQVTFTGIPTHEEPLFLVPSGDVFVGSNLTAFRDCIGEGTDVFDCVMPIQDSTDAFVFVEIPEPATLALFGTGLLGLGVYMRRRRKQQAA